MPQPKIVVFAAADEHSLEMLENAGCHLIVGSAGWSTPQGNSEDELVTMAQDADVLAGATIKSARISRRVMESTIGVIGLGRVGGRLAKLLQPWGARVIAADPYIESQRLVDYGVEQVGLDSLLRQADVVPYM